MTGTYIFTPLEEFHPAAHFSSKVAYYGVRLEQEREVGRGRARHTEVQPVLAFVTSDRELLNADKDELRARGLYVPGNFPPPPEPRFSPASIKNWIDGVATCPDPAQLYETVREAFATRVEFVDEVTTDVVALYTIGTYLHRDFDAYPYLAFTGSKASGKSKTGKLISNMAFNAVEAVTLTGGALYLEVEAHAATLLLDDREDLGGEEARAVDAMLNAGYKRGGCTIRGSWDTQQAKRFGIYSPKIITTIKGLNDVLGSRCIIVEMQPSRDRAKRKRSEEVGSSHWAVVRDDLYTWALSEWQGVRLYYQRLEPEPLGLGDLTGRAWELWKPLLAIASYYEAAGVTDLVKRLVAYATERYLVQQSDEADTKEGQVLAYLLAHAGSSDHVRVTPKHLSEQMLEEVGEKISPRSVGWMMKRLGFQKFKDDTVRPRAYQVPRRALLEAAERRGISTALVGTAQQGEGDVNSTMAETAERPPHLSGDTHPEPVAEALPLADDHLEAMADQYDTWHQEGATE